MRNKTSIAAVAAMAAAFSALQNFGSFIANATGHNKGDYVKPPRPRKYHFKPARDGIKSLDASNYEKRYGLGFRYKVGSKPFSAQR